jgi:outer membrane lipase/esterase
VIDVIHGSTSADTFTAAARAGYLINAGVVRVGPIAGFNYTHGVIGAYTESGDILLTMMVDRQTLNALTGNAGLQLRLPFVVGMVPYSPFINLTAEQDFAGSGRNVTTTLVTAPLLPILTPVSAQNRTTAGSPPASALELPGMSARHSLSLPPSDASAAMTLRSAVGSGLRSS